MSSACSPLLALLLAGPALGGDALPLRLGARTFTLENGLRAVICLDSRAPLAVVDVRVEHGTGSEAPAEAGAAHLLEHLAFAGSARVEDGELDRRLEDAGGESDAWTTWDFTLYRARVPAGAVDLVLSLEADRLAGLRLAPEVVQREQEVVQRELDEARDAPHAGDLDVLRSLLFPAGHPYGRPVRGTGTTVGALDGGTLGRLHRTWYAPSEVVVVVVGDVSVDAVEARIRAEFGALGAPGGGMPAGELAVAPARAGGDDRVLRADVADRVLLLGWPGPASRGAAPRTGEEPAPPDAALEVALQILASGPGSRLHDGLVRRGRAREVTGWTRSGRFGGETVVQVRSAGGRLAPLARRVEREIGRLARDGPTSDELARALAAREGAFLRSLESIESRAGILGLCVAERGQVECLDDELGRYRAVGAEDVRRAVGRWMAPGDRVALSVVGTRDRRGALPGSTPVEGPWGP